MTQITKLSYATKTNAKAIVNRTIQATAEDFNEIKAAVNDCVDGVNWIKADRVDLVSGVNHIAFQFAYPEDFVYVIIVHNCYNADGYLIAHTISGNSNLGFDVTVAESGTLVYMAVPKR
jgi:hypothetical protein